MLGMFIRNQVLTVKIASGCCYKKGTRYCCWITLALGCLVLILGIITLVCGNSLLTKVILKSMALKPGSDRLQSWLTPPVQPHLEGQQMSAVTFLLNHQIFLGYAFSVENSDEVIQGKKPKLKEVILSSFFFSIIYTLSKVGPFVYKAVTVKDSVDHDSGHVNLQYDENGESLTYRPR